MESSYTLCLGWKWYGEKKTYVVRTEGVATTAQDLLDEADYVIHYNGKSFDIPTLNKDIYLASLTPPSPYKQIDLCNVVKSQFRFPSNKLAYISEVSGLEGKVQHSGHELWVRCMLGEEKAWKEMERYNKRDVVLLEELYDRLLPWIPGHPNNRLFDRDGCPRCSTPNSLRARGYSDTLTGRFQRYRCDQCGGWSRSTKRSDGVNIVEAK